jgi:hypothetical protein
MPKMVVGTQQLILNDRYRNRAGIKTWITIWQSYGVMDYLEYVSQVLQCENAFFVKFKALTTKVIGRCHMIIMEKDT